MDSGVKAEQKETHIRLQETVRGINGRHQLSEEHHHEDSQHCLKTMKLKMKKAAKQEPLEFHFDLFKIFACFPELTFTTLGYRLQNGIKQIEKKEKKRKIKERKRGLW